MSGTDIVPKPAASEGSFVMPAGRRLSRVDSKTLRQSFNAQNQAVSTDEVEQILRNLDRKDNKIKYNRRMRMALIGAIGFLAVMVGAMFVVTFAANEASKEAHVSKDATLTALNGKPVATESFLSYAKLFDLPKFDIATLAQVKHLTVQTHEGLQASMEITKVTKETGSAVAKFYTANQDVITVDGESHIVMATIDGECSTIDITNGDVAMARKLSAAAAPRLYSEQEFFALADFSGASQTHRKLNKDSQMTGFAAVAIAASEAVLDVIEQNGSSDMTFGFTGKTVAGTKCEQENEFKYWTSKDRKEVKIDHHTATEREINVFLGETDHILYQFAKNDAKPTGWELKNCDVYQHDAGKSQQLEAAKKVKASIVSHKGNEFLVKEDSDRFLLGRASFGADADKLITLPTAEDCEAVAKAAEAAAEAADAAGRRLGGRALGESFSTTSTSLWDAAKKAYVNKGNYGSGDICEKDNAIAKVSSIAGGKMIAFSGTDGISQLADWWDNLDVRVRDRGIKYHNGFDRYVHKIYTCINNKAPAGGWKYCVGHSLGGAAATVYARQSGKCQKVVTYGAPKTLSKQNGAHLQCDRGGSGSPSGMRYYHNRDPITSDGAWGLPVLGGHLHDVRSAKSVWKQRGSCVCGGGWLACHPSGCGCGWRGCSCSCGSWGRHADYKTSRSENCKAQGANQGIISALIHFVFTTHTEYQKFLPSENV